MHTFEFACCVFLHSTFDCSFCLRDYCAVVGSTQTLCHHCCAQASQLGACLTSKSTGLDRNSSKHAVAACCVDLDYKVCCKEWKLLRTCQTLQSLLLCHLLLEVLSWVALVHSSNTAISHNEVLACSEACSALGNYVNAVQWDVHWVCVAVAGMVFEAKNELQQYLISINPIYAKYTEGLWANEVNSISQLGDASLTVLQACGVKNPVHAGNIIAQSRAPGKRSSFSYIV